MEINPLFIAYVLINAFGSYFIIKKALGKKLREKIRTKFYHLYDTYRMRRSHYNRGEGNFYNTGSRSPASRRARERNSRAGW